MSSSSPLSSASGSELSELSDIETAELEKKLFANKKKGGLDAWLHSHDGASSPPPKRKREPSPPHDYVLADNPDIAFIVMFRARFASAFPRFVPHIGPQDIENSIVGNPPGELSEKLLCAILGLVLNRKKDIGIGHYNRALEEAISSNRSQWPKSWEKSPISGDGSFHNMSPEQRLELLRILIMWTLNSSEAVQNILKDSYKQNRHDDDLNQPLSVQPWGRDSDKRRYWLIEGQDDTFFRLYRESNPALKTNTWWSVAGSIDEVKAVAAKLQDEGSQAARRLAERINVAIPRFEAGEEKRKRREYRMTRKMQFSRPEPGFSLYEGRTRGKRMKYTFSDDEDGTSDAFSGRRSTRNATPAETTGPTVTASGRQVRSRLGGMYGETLHSGQMDATSESVVGDSDAMIAVDSRTRSGRVVTGKRSSRLQYDSDEESDAVSSGNEWQGLEDADDDADEETDEDIEMEEDDDIDEADDVGLKSLVVRLQIRKPKAGSVTAQMNDSLPGTILTNGGLPNQPQGENHAKAKEEHMDDTIVVQQVTKKPELMAVGMPRPEIGTTSVNNQPGSGSEMAPIKSEVTVQHTNERSVQSMQVLTNGEPGSAPSMSAISMNDEGGTSRTLETIKLQNS